MNGRILVGTASWTDPSLIESGRFYPAKAKTAEDRLRYELWQRFWDDEHAERTLALLSERGLPYVVVDEPQGTSASVPPVVAATAPVAIVRFHGRNKAAWAKRNATVAEKYDYL
jgi:uncharacterized protein YecE (DUF72 family)